MDRHKDHFRGRHYEADNIHGPLSFLNPTTRRLPVHRPHAKPTAASSSSSNDGPTQVHTLDGDAEDGTDKLPIVEGEGEAPGLQKEEPHTGVYHVWRSRDNRKGRHALALTPSASRVALPPPARDSFSSTARGILKMLTRYPVWDVSYDVATVFTWGSVVWVINGFFEWLPLVSPSTEFPTEETWGGGLTAFIGATIFLFGSVLLMLEAVNENRSDCFGWALEDAMERESGGGLYQLKQEASGCRHHHGEKRAFLTRKNDSGTDVGKDDEDGDSSQSSNGGSGGKGGRKWQWWPSWHELKTHYFRDIGFLACFSQMCGASIFWIAGLTGIPTILNSLSVPAENGIYWLPQVIGGTGFIISSLLFMLETQPKWYIPAPKILGWHIGFWNLIGAIGFTLCGALGFASEQPGMMYALTLSTFIGSWAFLIGSVIQWYESLDKYTVTIAK